MQTKHFNFLTVEMINLVRSPFFILLTIVGNGFIGLMGYVFFLTERNINPNVNRYMDALWWSFTTATTTGYGDITPVTDFGKILSIVLMLTGMALFAMYTALFAESILLSKRAYHESKT